MKISVVDDRDETFNAFYTYFRSSDFNLEFSSFILKPISYDILVINEKFIDEVSDICTIPIFVLYSDLIPPMSDQKNLLFIKNPINLEQFEKSIKVVQDSLTWSQYLGIEGDEEPLETNNPKHTWMRITTDTSGILRMHNILNKLFIPDYIKVRIKNTLSDILINLMHNPSNIELRILFYEQEITVQIDQPIHNNYSILQNADYFTLYNYKNKDYSCLSWFVNQSAVAYTMERYA